MGRFHLMGITEESGQSGEERPILSNGFKKKFGGHKSAQGEEGQLRWEMFRSCKIPRGRACRKIRAIRLTWLLSLNYEGAGRERVCVYIRNGDDVKEDNNHLED